MAFPGECIVRGRAGRVVPKWSPVRCAPTWSNEANSRRSSRTGWSFSSRSSAPSIRHPTDLTAHPAVPGEHGDIRDARSAADSAARLVALRMLFGVPLPCLLASNFGAPLRRMEDAGWCPYLADLVAGPQDELVGADVVAHGWRTPGGGGLVWSVPSHWPSVSAGSSLSRVGGAHRRSRRDGGAPLMAAGRC
jgi:hypothetical protein